MMQASLEELLQALMEMARTDAWRLWRSYIANLLEAALGEMEEATDWAHYRETKGLVRALRVQADFIPELIRNVEATRKGNGHAVDDDL